MKLFQSIEAVVDIHQSSLDAANGLSNIMRECAKKAFGEEADPGPAPSGALIELAKIVQGAADLQIAERMATKTDD